MRLRTVLAGVLGLMLFLQLQGCATCKGAAEGFKEDWKSLGEVDAWMRENLW